ncbi:MAG: DUF4062 domain-containing protein [Bacteroidales bacterium]|nr:DUF4062 domain-containing protein [Bacteroidales bacterium]
MQNGKNIKVFLSSTFKDMDAERDLIMNRVAPTLQQLLAPQGFTLQFIDLRWGVNTQDADENERENIVLRECISEIRQSRPFFIGLLGDRYGWIPSVESWQVMLDEMTEEEREYIRRESREQKSVTELEMLFGALMDANSLRRCLFCFRDPAVYGQMDDVARRKFCNLNDEADRKLSSLKQKIVDGCRNAFCSNNIYEYNCRWDGRSLTGLDDLGSFLTKTLHAQIMLYEGSNAVENPVNEFQQMADADLMKIAKEGEHYVNCDSRKNFLNEIAKGYDEDQKPRLIYARYGYGKTAFLCETYRRFGEVDDLLVFIHFTHYGDTPAMALKKWLADPRIHPQRRYSLDEDVEFGELAEEFYHATKDLEMPPLLLIDDLHLMQNVYEFMFGGLQNFCMLIATAESEKMKLFSEWDVAKVLLPPVDADEGGQIVRELMKAKGKSLPQNVLNHLMDARSEHDELCCGCPLWDVLMVRKLTSLTAYDYEQIRMRGDGDAAIENYLTEITDEMGRIAPYPEQLFIVFLHDAARFMNFGFLWTSIRLLAATGFGLREQDFQAFAGDYWNQLEFSSMKRWLGDLLTIDSRTGVIDFSYQSYRQIVRYVHHEDDEPFGNFYANITARMGNLLYQNPNDEFACREMGAIAINNPTEEVLKAVLSSTSSLVWPHLVNAAIALSYHRHDFIQWFQKVLDIGNDNVVVLARDIAIFLSYTGDKKTAAEIVGIFNTETAEQIRKGEAYVYDSFSWVNSKYTMSLLLHQGSGLMFEAGDEFMGRLMLSMADECSAVLSAAIPDYDDYRQWQHLPDDEVASAASLSSMLQNVLCTNGSSHTDMPRRVAEALHTFRTILDINRNGNAASELYLQLSFYNLCSASEYCNELYLYHGDHKSAENLVSMLRDAINDMKHAHNNTAITTTAYSLAYSVISKYYEQYGDYNSAFYFQKQQEYAVFNNYRRFREGNPEVVRRYAAALDGTGRMLFQFFHEYDQAQQSAGQAITLFEELFDNNPTSLHADDLLVAAYYQMMRLKVSGKIDEAVALGLQVLEKVGQKPDAEPDPMNKALIFDELGEMFDKQGKTDDALASLQAASDILTMKLDADPDNDDKMRSFVINKVRQARVSAMSAGDGAKALLFLEYAGEVVGKMTTMMPDSLKVRNVALHYYAAHAQVDMVNNDMDSADEYREKIASILNESVFEKGRVEDFQLLIEFLRMLYQTAINYGRLEMAEICVGLEYLFKQRALQERIVALEQADMASTMQLLQQIDGLKNQ